jgi:hypothetical protein
MHERSCLEASSRARDMLLFLVELSCIVNPAHSFLFQQPSHDKARLSHRALSFVLLKESRRAVEPPRFLPWGQAKVHRSLLRQSRSIVQRQAYSGNMTSGLAGKKYSCSTCALGSLSRAELRYRA